VLLILLIRSAAFAQHTKSLLATNKQRWVARPCGSCKGAGFRMRFSPGIPLKPRAAPCRAIFIRPVRT
jgi:hypothetical protein